jgi:hypothetical protein
LTPVRLRRKAVSLRGSRGGDGHCSHRRCALAERQDLWSIPSNLKYVLAYMGISGDDLSAPLPPGGLEELVAHAAEWTAFPPSNAGIGRGLHAPHRRSRYRRKE